METVSLETKAAENPVESCNATTAICSASGRKIKDKKLGLFEEIILGQGQGVLNSSHM